MATPGNTQVTLSWTAFYDGGSNITKFEYRQKTSGSYGSWMDISNSPSTVSHTVTGLTTGTAYTFQVRAMNGVGNAGVSNEATATPVADDCADDTTTTCSVSPGSSVTGDIKVASDVDYFRLSVTSGLTYHIDLEGSPTSMGTLANPFIRLRDATVNSIDTDDNGGAGLNARLTWTADRTGTVYLLLASENSRPSETGTYTLTVFVPVPTPGIAGCGRSHWDRNKSLATQLLDASCEYQARSRNILADGQVSTQELAEITPAGEEAPGDCGRIFPAALAHTRYYDPARRAGSLQGTAAGVSGPHDKSGGGGCR